MLDSDPYTLRYNALPDVIDADQALGAMGRGILLDRLSEVILAFGLEDVYAIRLLHTHHPVQAGEWMVEGAESPADGIPALTTRAVARCGTRAAANVWAHVDGAWVAMEYSTDAAVLDTDPIDAHPDFAAAFAAVLVAAGAADILGLCAARRTFFAEHGGAAKARGFSLLETTDADRRANVLRYADMSDRAPGTTIQTVWQAGPGDDEAGCPVGGFKCHMTVECAENNSGGHYKKIGHDREPLPSH